MLRNPDLRDWPTDPEEQYHKKQQRLQQTQRVPTTRRIAIKSATKPTIRKKQSPLNVPPTRARRDQGRTFRPEIQLNPEQVTDLRAAPEAVFWIAQWWNNFEGIVSKYEYPFSREPSLPGYPVRPNRVPTPLQRQQTQDRIEQINAGQRRIGLPPGPVRQNTTRRR